MKARIEGNVLFIEIEIDSPIMPSASERLWEQLGQSGSVAEQRVPGSIVWGGLRPGTRTTKGESLFPRVDAD